MNDLSRLNSDHVTASILTQQHQPTSNIKSLINTSSMNLSKTSHNPTLTKSIFNPITATTSTTSNVQTQQPGASHFSTSSSNVPTSIVDAKKKKARLVPPSIRLELTIEPPDSEKSTEYNYNKLILKAFKSFKKQAKKEKKSTSDANKNECTLTKNDLPILESNVSIKKENISEFLSMYRKKIILSKELDDDERINGNQGEELHKLDDDNLDEENSRSCDLDDDAEVNGGGINSNLLPKKNVNRKKCSRNIYESDNNRYKLRDFAHLGKGYDENDSFIDNSDAVDVHVPSNMAPKRGGFYINKEQIKLEKIDKKGKRKSNLFVIDFNFMRCLFCFKISSNVKEKISKNEFTLSKRFHFYVKIWALLLGKSL
jgi:hypothetical protein